MGFSRRDFLKLLASGVIAQELDLDRLLWMPGKKTIFIPSGSSTISLSKIVEIEMERMIPKVRELFERDDMFYRAMIEKK
jgi:hypothetical protein